MLDETIIDAFKHNFDKHRDNPYFAQKLHSRIRAVVEEELPEIFPLKELNEMQWEYIRNRLVDIIDNVLLMRVKYLPKTDDEKSED